MKNGRNVIPRQFLRIDGTMLIETNMDRPGDKLHVFKNDSGYLALNLRTGKFAYMFASMLRDANIFKLEAIEK